LSTAFLFAIKNKEVLGGNKLKWDIICKYIYIYTGCPILIAPGNFKNTKKRFRQIYKISRGTNDANTFVWSYCPLKNFERLTLNFLMGICIFLLQILVTDFENILKRYNEFLFIFIAFRVMITSQNLLKKLSF